MRSKLAGVANWTNFVWDEITHELLAEYTLVSGTNTIKALNTHGIGLVSSNREGTKRYFHFDAIGSTAALADESEVVKDHYTYEAFGVVATATSTNGPSVNPFRFVGQWGYYDDGSMGSQGGLSLLGVRYLSPSKGRFLSRDPIHMLNAYVYVGNSATRKTDPSGTIAVQLGAGLGAIIGVGAGTRFGRKGERFECGTEVPDIPGWIIFVTAGTTKLMAKNKYCTTCQALCFNWCEEVEGLPGFDREACLRQCRVRFAECMGSGRWPPEF